MGVPPNHPFSMGFSITTHPVWGTPIEGNLQLCISPSVFFGENLATLKGRSLDPTCCDQTAPELVILTVNITSVCESNH